MLTVNVTLVNPGATVTLDGTVAIEVLLLESATTEPPAGAGPLSVTVPVEELPPIVLDGFNVTEVRTGGSTVIVAVCVTPLKTAERSEEHTSELQSRPHLVCRLLLEKKK